MVIHNCIHSLFRLHLCLLFSLCCAHDEYPPPKTAPRWCGVEYVSQPTHPWTCWFYWVRISCHISMCACAHVQLPVSRQRCPSDDDDNDGSQANDTSSLSSTAAIWTRSYGRRIMHHMVTEKRSSRTLHRCCHHCFPNAHRGEPLRPGKRFRASSRRGDP